MNCLLKKTGPCDNYILLLVIALTCFGIVMVYSASSVMADKRMHDCFFYLRRQGGFAVIGFIAMLIAMHIDYHFWRRWAVPVLALSLLLLTIVLIPGIGGSAGGASRWIKLIPGFRFQPSEFAKVALIIYMAFSIDRKQERIRELGPGFISYMIVLALLLLLLLQQPDFGAAVTLFLVAFVMLFAAGTRPVYILSVGILSLPLFYFLIVKVDYRLKRILAFLNPWADPQHAGYQIIQSWMAFGAGGLFGQGLGEGRQKLFYLPEAHTDFILAVIGEELGFMGVFVVIGLFAMFVKRAIGVSLAAPDSFGRLLALGIAVLIAIEAIINMGVVSGMLPTKGLALPFVNYGGSSLVVSLFACGILLNISSQKNLDPAIPARNKTSANEVVGIEAAKNSP